MAKVNLDAFIPREDFLVEGHDKNLSIVNLGIRDLSGITAELLRKPDFQRETSDWDHKKIAELLKSFINGDLIPSVIFWKGKGNIFVIDGAHRLSALMAWINDDYGDGEVSKKFYKNIQEDQLKNAEATRKYIAKQVGSYEDLKKDPNYQLAISTNAITLQWVNGDAEKAEQSFLKINQQAQPINATELRLLESRNKPVCIAARAVIYGGTGHKYWANFSADKQKEIVEIAKEIHDLLFKPPLKQPIKNIELPIGGKTNASTALKMILDFVKITNLIKDESLMKDDTEGSETLSILKNTRKIVWRLNSIHPSSLGLHPLVYFYSKSGSYRSASFLAFATFVLYLEQNRLYEKFTKNRKNFENFILKNSSIFTSIWRLYRGSEKSINPSVKYLKLLLDSLDAGATEQDILHKIKQEYPTLTLETQESEVESNDFNKQRKSSVFIQEVFENPLECKICGGMINGQSLTIDHIVRKEDGGSGCIENGQLAHPYCNTTYKN